MKISLLIIMLFLLNAHFAFADEKEIKSLHLGILSYRPKEITLAQWLPLANEIEKNLSGYHVEIEALNYQELDKAAKENKFDFIFTNPEHYILLKNKIGVNAIATLITLEKGHPLTHFAGVIFTRADRTDIQTLSNLNNKVIASPGEQSLGGYLMERWELEKKNIKPKSYLFTGMPQDLAVDEVLLGNVDAGFVRSGLLEKLEKSGKIQLGENATIRVLEPHLLSESMPVLHSTEHYPEWAFSAKKGISPEISRPVSLTLLNIKSDSNVAKAAGIAGFNSPADYTPVEVLMLRLRAHPDELKYFDLTDVFFRYKTDVAIGLMIGFLTLLFIVSLIVINRKLKRTETKLYESSAEIFLLLNSMAEGAYGVDNQGFCRFVNQSFLKILGYENADEIIGKHIHELIHHSHNDGTPYPSTECQMYNAYRLHKNIHVSDEVFWRKNGTPVSGVLTGAIATFIDITERQRIERELAESKTRLQAIIDSSPECIQLVDSHGKLLDINAAGLAMIEVDSVNEMASCSILDFMLPEYHEKAQALHRRVIAGEILQMEFEIIGRKGTRRWMETHAVPMLDNGEIVRLSITRDVTERKKAEKEIQQLAYYDSLTNLPNRRKLLERLNFSIQLNHRENKEFAVFMMDLDKFKAVNDSLGHAAGDDLLKQVAIRIKERLRGSDMVARLGGDEFVIVLENCVMRDDAAKVATNIIDDLTHPFELTEGDKVQIGASIGVAFYPQNGTTPEMLLDNADTALYQAKDNGRGCFAYYFTP
jgi:diguanylate cyclase (GGDEF)-like protein/PAS domain S-box-containing protein